MYIVLAYDTRSRSLQLVWTGFRSHAPSGQAQAALTGLVQALVSETAQADLPAHVVVQPRRRDHPAGELSAREVEILRLLAEGQTSPEMAKALGLSPRTVSRHLENIRHKFKVQNRTEVLLKAMQWGVLRLTPMSSTSAPKARGPV